MIGCSSPNLSSDCFSPSMSPVAPRKRPASTVTAASSISATTRILTRMEAQVDRRDLACGYPSNDKTADLRDPPISYHERSFWEQIVIYLLLDLVDSRVMHKVLDSVSEQGSQ